MAQLEKAKKALILLHGRGGTAEDILSYAEGLYDDSFYIVAPEAPNNQWYPHNFLTSEEQNEPWLSASVKTVKDLIDKISQVISKDKIFLMGFSQGACLALEVSARYATRYGGILGFSGGLIGKTINEKKYSGNFDGTKIFLGVSEKDPYIPLERVEESKEILEKMDAEVVLKVYPGSSHKIREDEKKWAIRFLSELHADH